MERSVVFVLELPEFPAMASESEQAFAAVRSGDVDILAGLLAGNQSLAASRDENGVSLLLTACYHRRPEMVELILASAGPLDIFESSAVENGADCGARLLEEAPALARAFSPDGFTPLHLAAYFGREAMAGVLLDRGAEPGAVSRNAMALQPLHSAAVSRSLAIVKRLLERRAEVNAQQQGGWTPLHAAAFNGDVLMAECLLAHGADPALRSNDGKTAIDVAVEKGHEPVVGLLKSRTASGAESRRQNQG
jgi:ankyrin repeat protein